MTILQRSRRRTGRSRRIRVSEIRCTGKQRLYRSGLVEAQDLGMTDMKCAGAYLDIPLRAVSVDTRVRLLISPSRRLEKMKMPPGRWLSDLVTRVHHWSIGSAALESKRRKERLCAGWRWCSQAGGSVSPGYGKVRSGLEWNKVTHWTINDGITKET